MRKLVRDVPVYSGGLPEGVGLHAGCVARIFADGPHAAVALAFAALDASGGIDHRQSMARLRDGPCGAELHQRAGVILGAEPRVDRQGHYRAGRISRICCSRTFFGCMPVTIRGLPSVGMKSSVGIERMPNTAASSCSLSTSIL